MRRALTILTVVTALVAAGCGGGGDGNGNGKALSKAEYGKRMAATGQTLQKAFADIGDQTGAKSTPKQVGDRLDRGATAVDTAVKQYSALTAPAAAKPAHAKLVAGLHELATELRKSATAARKNDAKGLNAGLQGLTTGDGIKKITEAQKELTAQGIKVTPSS
ncbi:MAG: hypothetical protein QOF26_2529 [Baekduia sp.]|jgi:hypothetical protein|nr:hypothetical protein [Baekduia sp.]MDX6702303.1 hypothetical protein [Baekduia sp.]